MITSRIGGDDGRAQVAFDEISALINIAESMQSEIKRKRRELINTVLYYALFISLYSIFYFGIKFTLYLNTLNESGILLNASFLLFFIAYTAISIIKIKNIKEDIHLELMGLKDIMETIFNLRKIAIRYYIEPEYLGILELKLRRIKFH